MTERPTWLFVYNADTGLFNGLADAAHKILSPETYACALCKVTYGWFGERGVWRDFLASLNADCRFLHRDEFQARFPEARIALPAVLRLVDDRPVVCLDAERLSQCADLDELMRLVGDLDAAEPGGA
ncbi:hypothetical protein [Thiocystis violacea]|uniref:hypothetical protein n=1 Tax=Thiocystis violacea TaxID=13725 RepID=UPI001906766E|nr:hypothetical protein [Thiocystis violacea]MBK1724590.1 hypothetical protein [Thiocystis violacea]